MAAAAAQDDDDGWSVIISPVTSPIQRVMVMKGHERNITRVVFNRDGDLLFSAASDKTPTVWDTETGERLGTYNGHSGSITDMSVSCKYVYMCSHKCGPHLSLTSAAICDADEQIS